MNGNKTNENNNNTNIPNSSQNEHQINQEKDHAGRGFLTDLKESNKNNEINNNHNNNNLNKYNPLNGPNNRINSLPKNTNNFSNKLGNGFNKFNKSPGNIPKGLENNKNSLNNNSNPQNNQLQKGNSNTSLNSNSAINKSQSSSNITNSSNNNSPSNKGGVLNKLNKGKQLANNVQNLKNDPSGATKQIAATVAKEVIKKHVTAILMSALPIIIPIISIFIVIIIFGAIIAGILGALDDEEPVNNFDVTYDDECGFTISKTNLTKEEFKEFLTNYANNTKEYKTGFSKFAEESDTIYDIAVANKVNPEIVVTRALSEGFIPGSGNNYWGLDCTNIGGLKSCSSYPTFGAGVQKIVNSMKNDSSIYDFMMHYSEIGDYWYNPGGTGLGGCYYASVIYPENMPDRVRNACAETAPSCGREGGDQCTKTTEEDQQLYAKWQVKTMTNSRIKIFGQLDQSFCQTSNDANVQDIINLTDDEAWKELTGTSTDYKLVKKEEMTPRMISIEVPVRVWSKPDENNYDTEKATATIQVNKFLVPLFKAFFNDLYTNAPDFVIVPSELACYDYRPKRSGGGLSAHSYGAACDINPNTEGNFFKGKIYTKSEWQKLKKSKAKYQIIYEDSDVVKIAHKYTLSWGGEWQSVTDGMHFSFIGDTSREYLKSNFGNKN